MAFLRRKGNTFYLVHNVREGSRVRQLHLAKLGERPRITDDVVRQVTRSYPFVEVNWRELREEVNNRVELFDPKSNQVQKLVSNLRNLNLDLADFFRLYWMYRMRRKLGMKSLPSCVSCTLRLALNWTNLTALRTGACWQTGSSGRR